MPEITDHKRLITTVVAAQAPHRFAAVVTTGLASGEPDVTVLGWGLRFVDKTAYLVSADGSNEYFLAEAENALMYITTGPDAVADLVWIDGNQHDQGNEHGHTRAAID